jgi:hypothetical protein
MSDLNQIHTALNRLFNEETQRIVSWNDFLLYAPAEVPTCEDVRLLDIRFYSHTLRADKASILLQQPGLVNLHLRIHVSEQPSVRPGGLTTDITDSTDNTDDKFTISVSSVSFVVSEQPSVRPGGLTTDSTDNTDNKLTISVPSVPSVSSVVSEQPSVRPGGLTTDSTDNTDNKLTISVPSVSSVVKNCMKTGLSHKTHEKSIP